MKAKKKTPAKRKGSTALVKKETGLPKRAAEGVKAITSVDPMMLLAQSINKKLPIESMERLIALRDKMKAEWARERFFEALAGFQRDCPIIGKNRTAKIRSKKGEDSSFEYKYAPLETIIAEAQPVLERWGFSWTCKPSQTATHVKASVHAHHKDGHEEVTEFEVPLDPASYMSEPQKAAAASTFARRYAFINAFGITTRGEDNDAKGDPPRGPSTPFTPPQEKAKDEPVPVHAEVKQTDYEKAIYLLKSVATDPKTKQTVRIFNENEVVDYTHQCNEARDKPSEMKVILDDIIATGKKRQKAVKGTE